MHFLFLITLTFCLLLTGCADKKEASKKPPKSHLVEAVTAEQLVISVERERRGTLRAVQEIQIFNQEEGQITELPFFEGDLIKSGDVVARLDDRLLKSQLTRTQALRRKAEKDLQRIRGLAIRKLTTEAEITRVETELAVAKADEMALATRLEYTTIQSPIDGVVSQRLSEPGNIAERYTHLLTVSDQRQLVTEVTVSELLINKLQKNDPVVVQIDALDQTQNDGFQGVISRIHPNLDPVTRTGVVEILLDPVPSGARPGQLARVTLRTQEAQRLLIPFVALRRSSQGEYVFVVDEQQVVQKKPVLSGLRIDDQIEILRGLASGQQVVVRGFTNLRSKQKVTMVASQPSLDATASSATGS